MNVIVCTTINPPTTAIEKYDALPDWQLIVVGDRKTPTDYRLTRGLYLSPRDQEAHDKRLSDLIGWDSIQRRNFGFVAAWRAGAQIVATVDDDNVPFDDWGRTIRVGRSTDVTLYDTELPAFDPVGATNYPHLWHRGFPLQLLPHRSYSTVRRDRIVPDVQADFWDGDPDVDAVCRMQFTPKCRFDASYFPFASTVLSPFDSQNTFIARRWLPNYFLFPHIGRMDDIWASFHLQALGARVVYCRSSVVHERNEHDPVTDMRQEYLGYENNLRIVEALRTQPGAVLGFLPRRSLAAFERYRSLF